MNNILILIPARFNSKRLPGKPLIDINGKSMIQRTYEQAIKSKLANDVIILTDVDKVYQHVVKFNEKCIIIDNECLNGTERICHALKKIDKKYSIIVNLHGDEPFINPENIDNSIKNFINKSKNDPYIKCGTSYYKMKNIEDILNPSKGKIILDQCHNILYVSRTPIPVLKNGQISKNHNYYSPTGVFVYNREYLENEYIKTNTPCQLCEDIEWLKILETGYKITSTRVEESERSIDTLDDYHYILEKYE